MSEHTFTDAEIESLEYEMDIEDVFNDVLLIEGASGSELLVRGVDEDSVAKYFRRSYKLNRPLAESEATAVTLVDTALDKYREPPIRMTLITKAIPDLEAVILDLEIGEVVTVNSSKSYINLDFTIRSIDAEVVEKILTAKYGLEYYA